MPGAERCPGPGNGRKERRAQEVSLEGDVRTLPGDPDGAEGPPHPDGPVPELYDEAGTATSSHPRSHAEGKRQPGRLRLSCRDDRPLRDGRVSKIVRSAPESIRLSIA